MCCQMPFAQPVSSSPHWSVCSHRFLVTFTDIVYFWRAEKVWELDTFWNWRTKKARLPLNAIKLDPNYNYHFSLLQKKNTKITSLVNKPFLLISSRLRFLSWNISLGIFRRIKLWVYSISLPSLGLIGSQTTEIFYRTEKNWIHR